jgi:competence ComEA-like helix-hairpin-helix protein
MHLLRSFQERFGFTRNELTAVCLLAAAFLAGSAVKLWIPPGAPSAGHTAFSYAHPDSQFLALSQAPRDTVARQNRSGVKKGSMAPGARSIDLNSAPEEELIRLPGIGQSLARRILAYRAAHGRFPGVDALADVRGIGPKTLVRIRPYLTVVPESTRRVP